PVGQPPPCPATPFSKLQSRLDAPRRARLRALDTLQKLQAAAPELAPAIDPPSLNHSPQTTSPQIGFVPPPPAAAPPQPAPEAPAPVPTSQNSRPPPPN